MAEKGGHKHFMHKEIHEQPRAVADTLRGRVLLSEGDVFFEGWSPSPAQATAWARVTILACGTSWHAGLVGKAMIESLVRMPVEVELASRVPLPRPAGGAGAPGARHQPVRARPWTRWPRCARPRPAAPAPWPSAT